MNTVLLNYILVTNFIFNDSTVLLNYILVTNFIFNEYSASELYTGN